MVAKTTTPKKAATIVIVLSMSFLLGSGFIITIDFYAKEKPKPLFKGLSACELLGVENLAEFAGDSPEDVVTGILELRKCELHIAFVLLKNGFLVDEEVEQVVDIWIIQKQNCVRAVLNRLVDHFDISINARENALFQTRDFVFDSSGVHQ